MSRFIVAASVVTATLAMPIAQNLHDRAYYEEKFFNWLSVHKIEAKNGDHFVNMIQNFANNDDLITTHNNAKKSFTLGHNQFSHLSLDEFRAYVKLGLNKPSSTKGKLHEVPVNYTGTSVDWVSKGAVTPVKDQGQCGSCWSFSATGAMEGRRFVAGHALVSLSEENLVDCDNRKNTENKGTDMGCNGGLMDSAFDWTTANKGLCSEGDYPYKAGGGQEGTCNTKCTKVDYSAPIDKYDIPANSNTAMMSALDDGPVSVAIEADTREFQLYKSGVFTADCGVNLDHGVLAVGYGIDGDEKFYNVKNSWGASWGENGYIRFAKESSIDEKQPAGQCGILAQASYPIHGKA